MIVGQYLIEFSELTYLSLIEHDSKGLPRESDLQVNVIRSCVTHALRGFY